MMLPTWNLINFPMTQQHAAMCHYYYYPQEQHPQENGHVATATQTEAPAEAAAAAAQAATTTLAQASISKNQHQMGETETETSKLTSPTNSTNLTNTQESLAWTPTRAETEPESEPATTSSATTTTATNDNYTATTISTTTTTTKPLDSKPTSSARNQLQAIVHQQYYPASNYTSNPYQYLYNNSHPPPPQLSYFVANQSHYNGYAMPASVYYCPTSTIAPEIAYYLPYVQHVYPNNDYYSQLQLFLHQQQQLHNSILITSALQANQVAIPTETVANYCTIAEQAAGTTLAAPERARLASHLISLLPIEAQPSKTRQAYGMGKVWEEEFEGILGEMSEGIVWKLLEVESNPNLNDRSEHIIVAYRGHYVVRPSLEHSSEQMQSPGRVDDDDDRASCCNSEASAAIAQNNDQETLQNGHKIETDNLSDIKQDDRAQQFKAEDVESDSVLCDAEDSAEASCTRQVSSQSSVSGATDSGFSEATSVGGTTSGQQTPVHSSRSSCSSAELQSGSSSECEEPNLHVLICNDEQKKCEAMQQQQQQQQVEVATKTKVDENEANLNQEQANRSIRQQQNQKLIPARFRMFIDSAKVRFCCDECGHGWTSMKGRVVFWYELFELENYSLDGTGANQMFGFCAYKLFGQQCDICKVEARFERPMWYPEEVAKVLGNLCNKIGQVYFGFRTPAIDKQRRAGKPKTSHNSSLCQACHDGLCTDRK